jgi:hypothetical protein
MLRVMPLILTTSVCACLPLIASVCPALYIKTTRSACMSILYLPLPPTIVTVNQSVFLAGIRKQKLNPGILEFLDFS